MPAAAVMSTVDEDSEGDSLNLEITLRYQDAPQCLRRLTTCRYFRGMTLATSLFKVSTLEVQQTLTHKKKSSLPDPRGEAPPYFEVVDQPEGPRREMTMTESPVALEAPPLPPPSSPEQRPPRHSTFRNLLNRISVTTTSHHLHTRVGSDNFINTRRRNKPGLSPPNTLWTKLPPHLIHVPHPLPTTSHKYPRL